MTIVSYMTASARRDATKPSLGTVPIDLESLLETRLLVQANSGGGKSYCLRRLLEQTATGVQQIVIDPEGEFATLREKFDYIICAPQGADAVATPATAAALARAVWESGTSAIVDIYELKAHERTLFVRRFCEALVNAPKKIWHPTLVVIDEVHMFAPQVGSAESGPAVIDLATRGRKRGLALVGATQRLSKLHKDVAAELLNKIIGRTGLDVDVQRAADELGMSRASATEELRNLEPGEFFAFGPALTRAVERIKIGPVSTTHPKTGQRALTAPPPPSTAVREKLAKLEGIQREAVEEAHTVEVLKADNAKLQRELAAAEKRAKQSGVPEAEVQRREREARKTVQRETSVAPAARESDHTKALAKIASIAAAALGAQTNAPTAVQPRADQQISASTARAPRPGPVSVEGVSLRSGARKILGELVARSPAGYSLPQVGTLTRFAHTGGTFRTYMGDLRRAGFVEERSGLVFATDAGIASTGGARPSPKTHDEVMSMWRSALRLGAYNMLASIAGCGGDGCSVAELASAVNMEPTGGTFRTYLGDLRRNGLITDAGGVLRANDILYPEKS